MLVLLFVSCSSSGSSNDSDAVSDADRDTQEPPTVVDEDAQSAITPHQLVVVCIMYQNHSQ